ncbi:ATP synthase F0 subunit B [bacterium]|nr:ATP synthase F0 subunit B [bacterium]|tara:strand:+ start:5409 stop:5918 length:510 start_codon:yes stop_codon:yes gene_type:complete
MELLGKLGINWTLLLAQIINFLVLFFLLKKFLYKPILGIIEKRQKKIKKGLENAEKAEHDLARASARAEKIIIKANKESQDIIRKSEKQAEQVNNKMIAQAEEKISDLQLRAKDEISQAKEQMLEQARDELADLVVLATERVLEEKIDGKKDKMLVERALIGVSKVYED